MPKQTPYQLIFNACMKGTGVTLTAEEVETLSDDDAIMVQALDDWAAQGFDINSDYPFKKK